MTDLCKLATKYGTDLCKLATKYGTDKAGWYTPVYDLLLRDRREQVKTVLEIGVGTKEAMQHVPGYQPGASLRMWDEYFPNAEIFGADIVPNELPNDPFVVIQVDQSNAADLLTLADFGPFDLIIDDGSHVPAHQILGAITLVPHLRPDGLYIIEDVNNFIDIEEELAKRGLSALYISHPSPLKNAARCVVIRG